MMMSPDGLHPGYMFERTPLAWLSSHRSSGQNSDHLAFLDKCLYWALIGTRDVSRRSNCAP